MPSAALLLFLTLLSPSLDRLGSDDWPTREAESKRLDNFLSPLALPAHHPDPEVDARVKFLRVKNLKWCNPWWREQLLKKHHFREWARAHWLTGRTGYGRADVFAEMLGSHARRNELREVLVDSSFLTQELWYSAFAGESFTAWCELLDYHWKVIPVPREVTP